MKRTLVLLLLTAGFPTALSAQIAPGDPVRLKSVSASGRFTVVTVDSTSLHVRDSSGSVHEAPLATLDRLDVYRGRRSTAGGLLRGAAIGGVAGASLGIVAGLAAGTDPQHFFTTEEMVIILGVMLGGSGALAGGVIGMVAPGERWERVRVGSQLTVVPSADGVGVGYTYRF